MIAELQNANFTNAELQNAKFGGAELQGAIFHDAILDGADLSRAIGFTKEQLCSAESFDETTKLPPELEGMTMAKCKEEKEKKRK